jgi:hypothetical protein
VATCDFAIHPRSARWSVTEVRTLGRASAGTCGRAVARPGSSCVRGAMISATGPVSSSGARRRTNSIAATG